MGFLSGKYKLEAKDQPPEGSRTSTEGTTASLVHQFYFRDDLFKAVEHLTSVSGGIPGNAIALRWLVYHSLLKKELGDAIILGASKNEQLSQSVEWMAEGPLSAEILSDIEAIWKIAEPVAPAYHF